MILPLLLIYIILLLWMHNTQLFLYNCDNYISARRYKMIWVLWSFEIYLQNNTTIIMSNMFLNFNFG